MALTSIRVEQFSADKWTGEVEVGGLVSRRKAVRALSFEGLLEELRAAYRGMVPARPKRTADQLARDEMRRLAEAREAGIRTIPVIAPPEPVPAAIVPPRQDQRGLLLERARLAGVDVDGRWSDARLLYQVGLAEEAEAARER